MTILRKSLRKHSDTHKSIMVNLFDIDFPTYTQTINCTLFIHEGLCVDCKLYLRLKFLLYNNIKLLDSYIWLYIWYMCKHSNFTEFVGWNIPNLKESAN